MSGTHIGAVPGSKPPAWQCSAHPEPVRFDSFADATRHEIFEHPPGLPTPEQYARDAITFAQEASRALALYGGADHEGFLKVAFADFLRRKYGPVTERE